jgi:glycosyltransferase involved in cell wall biosynthesis
MIHELYPQQFSRRDPTARDKKKIVQNSDAVICISRSTKHDLMLYCNVPEERIKVIYLGNSLKLEVKSPRIVDAPYILYVGLRDGYKNFDLLLTAYARSEKINRDFKLVCFGGGQFNSHERSLIRSMNLGDKVFNYSGTDEPLANLYKYASAFIYPSLHEGFGIPPLEAMGYGCPVLVSNTSSVPEVVGQAGLYFNPTNVDDLTFQLDKILRDDMLRKDLIQQGYEQEKKFSWDRCAKETLKLYHQI